MSAADEAYREWSTHPQFNTWVSVENAFIEGYRRALEDAADQWQQGEWADALSGTQRPEHAQARLATAQAVTDWLRTKGGGDQT